MAGCRVALLAYGHPKLSRFVLAHVLTEAVSPPDEPRRGRHAAPRKRRGWRWPGWLRPARRERAVASVPWWRNPGEPDLPVLKPITGPTPVTLPRLRAVVPAARVAGCPPWERKVTS